jgi:hypothetical protein
MTRAELGTRWRRLPHPLRWAGVAAVGGTLTLVGLALLALPGPGIPLLVAGLVVLASEFAWAESILRRVKTRGTAITSTITGRLRRSRGNGR